MALAHDDSQPSLVLDAGTGLRTLSQLLGDRPFRGRVVLGHLHLDHVQGLPFFPAAEHPDSRVDVYIPAQGSNAEEVLARVLSPPTFPLRPSELRGQWRFHMLEPGEHAIGGFSVLAREIPHGGGRTFGFRVSDGSATVAYLSDHSPLQAGPGPDGLGERHGAALELAEGVDLLIHDAQHLAAEFPAKAFLGHSSVEYALSLADTAGARRLLLFHHDWERSDDELDAVTAAHQNHPFQVLAAREGQVLQLPSLSDPW